MKVRSDRTTHPTLISRATIVLSVSFVLLLGVFVTPASAITRSQVLSRASTWIRRQIPYSQRGYYAGYRRDCSGFVSMAWKLNTSYTTRTISSRARRVSISTLKPGDAVLTRGHVAVFGGWKNKRLRQYYALEQTHWGDHARKRVRTIPSRATGLRRRGIS